MSHYLVTGCAGFIGAKVTELLLAAGHGVTGIDNLNDAYDVRLKQWRLAQIQDHPQFRLYRVDIVDRTALESVFTDHATRNTEPFAAIINLAARAGVRQSVENPWVYIDTNTTGTLNLLELARQHSVPKFVLSSTSSLYGQHNPMPYREDAGHQSPALALRGHQEGCGSPLLHLSLPVWPRCDGLSLLHRLWSWRATGYEPLSLCPVGERRAPRRRLR